jgi:hypothetical protein
MLIEVVPGRGLVAVVLGFPSHADLIGWAGTILSLATAFTGGFVMIYQRIQRARRDDRIEWMKLRQGSLEALLETSNRELEEARVELALQTAKLDTLTKQNGDQLEQIIELTRHITRLGALLGRLPHRLGLTLALASAESPANSIETLGQTVVCLEGLVEQLHMTTQVLSKLAEFELERPVPNP